MATKKQIKQLDDKITQLIVLSNRAYSEVPPNSVSLKSDFVAISSAFLNLSRLIRLPSTNLTWISDGDVEALCAESDEAIRHYLSIPADFHKAGYESRDAILKIEKFVLISASS